MIPKKLLESEQDQDKNGDFQSYLNDRVLRLGFDNFQMRIMVNNTGANSTELNFDNYPEAWRKIYSESGYALIDPISLYCSRNVTPIFWCDSLYSSPKQLRLREQAKAHGLEHGVTFAMYGPNGQVGTFGISTQLRAPAEANALILQHLGALSMLRDEALQTAIDLLAPVANPAHIKLTVREREILRWCAYGKSSWEISNICSCTESNVEFHIKNIRRKFGVSTRRAAVAQALLLQLIQI